MTKNLRKILYTALLITAGSVIFNCASNTPKKNTSELERETQPRISEENFQETKDNDYEELQKDYLEASKNLKKAEEKTKKWNELSLLQTQINELYNKFGESSSLYQNFIEQHGARRNELRNDLLDETSWKKRSQYETCLEWWAVETKKAKQNYKEIQENYKKIEEQLKKE